MISRIECREQMHYAEHLARHGVNPGPAAIAKIEAAYRSPNCETKIAQRISVALETI